jgi:copper(I)-binding protein
LKHHVAACILAFIALPAWAQVTVHEPWIRATVPGQPTAGAYMRLTAGTDARLVSASSPVAGVTELHQMTMDKGVMRMRAVAGIDIPAGKGAELKPGGLHIMMMDLKRPMKEGETVPITLVVEDGSKRRSSIEVKATVRAVTGASSHRQH